MIEFLSQPWPWYVAGPIIGLFVPALLLFGGKQFGVSANLRHMCAATVPGKLDFLIYDWKKSGIWNLTFVVGITLGGFLGTVLLATPGGGVELAPATEAALRGLGITDFSGFVPTELLSWQGLLS